MIGDYVSLADRMMIYESATKYQFDNDKIVVARIDGRGFSKFTKNFDKPFDSYFTQVMIETTKFLVEETSATIGYTQSDEISLIWHTDNPQGQIFFNGKLQKLASVCASIATAKFNRMYTNTLAFFDCRVFTVPNKAEAVNYLLYRQHDCVKNSISMATSTVFSHKEQMNVNTTEKLDMLESKNVKWDLYPAANRIGTFVQRQSYEGFSEDPRNPGMLVPCTRSQVINLCHEDRRTFDDLNVVVFGEKDVK